MFTGIVQGVASVLTATRKPGLLTSKIKFPADGLNGVARGASIAIDGVCLTVTEIEASTATFDIMAETLNRTTINSLGEAQTVNFERSLKFGDEIGGHLLSGHVDGVAAITKIDRPENNCSITLTAGPEWMKYLFPKGYIALNGASLTLSAVDKEKNTFTVSLIPETLRLTTFGSKLIGDKLNLEIERPTQVMVDTVNDFLNARLANARIVNNKILLD